MSNTNKKLNQSEVYLIEVYKKLVAFKAVDDKENFFETVKNVMPGVRKYIKSIFKRLVKNKQLPEGKYKVNDFIDELYISAYNNIQKMKEDENLYIWLIKQADIILDDILTEEDFKHTFFKNIDDYTKVELDEMEENYFIDADGDYVMEEDADDIFLPKNNYTLKDVFVENIDADIMKTINKRMKKERINNNIEMLAGKFPLLEYSIFDLNIKHGLSAKQIAEIKHLSIDKIEDILENMKYSIKSIFHKRLF